MTDDDWLTSPVAEDEDPPVRIDTTVAHQSRIYDYLLGGKDNYAADREAAERALEAFPGLRAWARNNRASLSRAVRFLVAEAGIRQFLDIGTGLPTAENTHEVAQRLAPAARICYVDNDPTVLLHARALLTSHPDGRCAYLDADFREPATILAGAAETLDLSQPVAVMLLAILHVIPDSDDPQGVIARIMAALPSGSYLVISHPASDLAGPGVADEIARRFNERMGGVRSRARSRDEVARLFTGLELVPPGIVPTPQWRPEPGASLPGGDPAYAGIARKPLWTSRALLSRRARRGGGPHSPRARPALPRPSAAACTPPASWRISRLPWPSRPCRPASASARSSRWTTAAAGRSSPGTFPWCARHRGSAPRARPPGARRMPATPRRSPAA